MLDSSYRTIISYAIFHHFVADDRDDILKAGNWMLHKWWWMTVSWPEWPSRYSCAGRCPSTGWCASETQPNSIWLQSEALGLCEQQVYWWHCWNSSPAMTSAVSKSQRTLNGLAFLVNNMYITYAIQHGYLSYTFPYSIWLMALLKYVYDSSPTMTFAVSKSVMRQVATILKTQGTSFKLRSVNLLYNLIVEQWIKPLGYM